MLVRAAAPCIVSLCEIFLFRLDQGGPLTCSLSVLRSRIFNSQRRSEVSHYASRRGRHSMTDLQTTQPRAAVTGPLNPFDKWRSSAGAIAASEKAKR